MATVEQVATEVLAAVDSSAGLVQAGNWVAQRYRQFASKARLRHLREVGELVIPAVISAGTVTATEGSDSVTADATAQAALSGSIVGRHIRIRASWYEIEAYAAPTITLTSTFAEESGSGLGYKVAQRFSTLAAEVRWIGTLVHMRLRTALRNVSPVVLDHYYPDRVLASSFPLYWAEVGEDESARAKKIEIYPYSDQDEIIHYVYWREPTALTLTSTIPSHVAPDLLREGALIDLFRFKAAQAADRGQVEIAALWRNEAQVQRTLWERMCLTGMKQDMGVPDVSFILQKSGLQPYGDIVDARGEVYSRGNRP